MEAYQKHLQVRFLWLQEAVRGRELEIAATDSKSNKADLGALVDGLDVGGGAEDEEDDLLALMDMAG